MPTCRSSLIILPIPRFTVALQPARLSRTPTAMWISLLLELVREVQRHEHALTEYARQQLGAIEGLTLIGNPKNRVSVVSFELPGIPTPEVGQLLDKEGIAVRAGHHCAQPALRALGYEMSVRPSFAFYNTKEEIDRLVIAVRKIIGRV